MISASLGHQLDDNSEVIQPIPEDRLRAAGLIAHQDARGMQLRAHEIGVRNTSCFSCRVLAAMRKEVAERWKILEHIRRKGDSF